MLIIDVERIDLAHHAGLSCVSIGGEALVEIRYHPLVDDIRKVTLFLPPNPASSYFYNVLGGSASRHAKFMSSQVAD